MELKLYQFIECFTKMFPVNNLEVNSFNVRLTNGVQGDTTYYNVLASGQEPIHLNFPINGIWVNLDSTSKYFTEALTLVGYSGEIDLNVNCDPALVIKDAGYKHSWVKLSTYTEIFRKVNFYYDLGPKGPQGDPGPKGPQGDSVTIDYLPIIEQATLEVARVLP